MDDGAVTIVLRAVDQASAQLRHVSNELRGVGGSAGRLGGMMGTLSTIMQGGISGWGTALTVVQNIMGTLGDIGRVAIGAVISVVKGAISVVMQLGTHLLMVGGILAGIATGAVGLGLRYGIGEATNIERQRAQLEALTKSYSEAGRIIEWVRKQAKATPFEVPDLVEMVAQLKSVNIDFQKWFVPLGDLAVQGGRDLREGMSMATLALVRLKTGATGEAMEQLRRLKISQEDFRKYGMQFNKGGELTSSKPAAIEALGKIIEEKFGGSMAKMQNTAAVAFSNVRDKLRDVALMVVGIGKGGEVITGGIFQRIRDAVIGLLNYLEKNEDKITAITSRIGAFFTDMFKPENLKRGLMFFVNIYTVGERIIVKLQNLWGKFMDSVNQPGGLQKIATYVGNMVGWVTKSLSKLLIDAGVTAALLKLPLGMGAVPAILNAVGAYREMKRGQYFTPMPDFNSTTGNTGGVIGKGVANGIMAGVAGVKGLFTSKKSVPWVDDLVSSMSQIGKAGTSPGGKPGASAFTAQEGAAPAMDSLMGKIFGGGDYTAKLLKRAMFGAGGMELARPTVRVVIDIRGGDARDKQIAREVTDQVVQQLAGKLGGGRTGVQPIRVGVGTP